MRSLHLLVLALGSCALAQAPASIDLPPDAHLLLAARAAGVQRYACSDGHWVLKEPDAKLFDAQGQLIGTHFAGPTWRLNDGGEVKGKAIANRAAPDGASIPWLLVAAVPGSGSGRLATVAYIRRTDTHGGAAPQEACTGGELPVPYTASYSFYTAK